MLASEILPMFEATIKSTAAVEVRGDYIEDSYVEPGRVSIKGSLVQYSALIVAYYPLRKCKESSC